MVVAPRTSAGQSAGRALQHVFKALPGAAKRVVRTVSSWLVDTGCGHDLISKHEVSECGFPLQRARQELTFNTANGNTTATSVTNIPCEELDGFICPHVLDSTPAVISVGRRCMKLGWSFHWPSYRNPYFIRPDGKLVELHVRDDIPYLAPGDALCEPREPDYWTEFPSTVPCAAAPCDVGPDDLPDIDEDGINWGLDLKLEIMHEHDKDKLFCEIPCGPCNIHTYMFGRSRDLLAQRYDKGATHFVGMPRKGRKLWWRVERHVTMADDGTIIRDVWVDKVLPDPESPPGAAVPSPEAAEVDDPAPDTPNAEKDQDFDARRRGVMRNKRYKKGASQREPTKWGGTPHC